MGRRFRIAIVGVCLAAVSLSAPAQAVFPGQNGKLAVTSGRDGNTEIYVMNADASSQVNLTNDSRRDEDPAWSPDGTKIAFTRGAEFQSNGEIWLMNADGSGQVNLSQSPSTEDVSPSWSPDGTKIAFASCCPAGPPAIYSMNADGTGRTRLTDGETPEMFAPRWSPHGTKIAFYGADPESFSIYQVFVMNADGSGVTQITHGAETNFGPSWSPDGTKLVFSKQKLNEDGFFCCAKIYAMNADGTNQTQLTDTSAFGDEGWDGGATFSPDGTKIAFGSCCREGFRVFNLYVMNPDGSSQTRITTSGEDYQADWQRIAANRPPDCSSARASRAVLRHDHRLVRLTLEGVTDPDGDPVSFAVDGVTQDEPVTGRGDRTSPDAIDKGEGKLRIRAERHPRGNGRVYRIAFTASDGRGGSCSGTAKVAVPRKKHKPAIDSAPPSYDSLAR